MKIGLMGFEFCSANKGCEALVYSFLSIIENKMEEKDIIYNYSGTDLGCVPQFFNNLSFVNINPRLKDYTFRYLRSLYNCDIIFDVTMGDSFSDIYSKSYYDGLIRNKKIANFLCKRYILLPQTYGPFNEEDSEKKAQKVFNKSYKIFCRDEMSQKLLSERFNIHNSLLSSDMAFVLPFNKTLYSFSSNKKIGINVSGLLYKGGFYTKNQFNLSLDYKKLIDNLISNLSKKYDVHLIPHVIDLKENAYDDDYKTCKLLHEKFPRTFLAPAFKTPIEAKSYISNMDIFIGSRMHSTIASFSSGVVTISISYSRKFEGLFGSLNYPYVINARAETTDSAYELVNKYIEIKEELRKKQTESLKLIEEKNKKFKKNIEEILDSK